MHKILFHVLFFGPCLGKCEVFSSPESMRKVTEIAARHGKSTGLWHI